VKRMVGAGSTPARIGTRSPRVAQREESIGGPCRNLEDRGPHRGTVWVNLRKIREVDFVKSRHGRRHSKKVSRCRRDKARES
jgi:hypothetical protein